MLKTAATAQALREIALKNGIIPVGRKWKLYAKRLVKQLSDKHPNKKSIDDIIPEKKYWENISKIDNYYHNKHNMLDREFSGDVDKDYAAAMNIGNHQGVINSHKVRSNHFHKHPGSFMSPSPEDFSFLKDSMPLSAPAGHRQSGYIFTNNVQGRGLIGYSSKLLPNGKTENSVDLIYKRDPSRYDLNGRYKVVDENGNDRRVKLTTRTINDIEYKDNVLNDKINVITHKGRQKARQLYNENLQETDPNWIKHHEDVFKRKLKRLKQQRKNK